MSVQAALNAGRDRLRAAGIEGAEKDARWLMAAALGLTPDRVILHLRDPLSEEVEFFYENALGRRLAREPVSHILGGRWFYGRWFHVTADVLDPRPETEILIEQALRHPFKEVLDLGTGTGCILLSLLAERPEATGIGTDISPQAFAIAEWNAAEFNVGDRLALIESDWFSAVGGRFDLIVSNPPYIAAVEMAALAPDVRDYEPHGALTDGADGLSAYRAIAAAAPGHLTPDGRVLVEIGPSQGRAVSDLFAEAGLSEITVTPDFDGRDRVVGGTWHGPS
ncbi:peptide chain release factor N(5)-glutamine methyltransferase [Fontisubflavum oceani]|uniref:peptide chain release factor N(5)-glutamine methyltransferase n=1 Tax=Fontisubflavum oceani TaxID=2978973 RepID=UPI0025B3156C|nr:peptide chain release factor N(5)-glutamine methyltransferase [Fontisubflavum oceani]WJY21230.1 peptide chain release factor N(5)-glutamine methyltransferase [Fontisubflavum oceani]